MRYHLSLHLYYNIWKQRNKVVCSALFITRQLIILSLWISPLSAGMQDNLEKAFSALGMSNNVTSAGGYQDQTGVFIRAAVFLVAQRSTMRSFFPYKCPIIGLAVGESIFLWAGLAISMGQLLPNC